MGRNYLFAICWLFILVVIAWPVAAACAGFWILLQPFESLFRCVRDINDFLERLITWPRECGRAIVDCHSSCPNPL